MFDSMKLLIVSFLTGMLLINVAQCQNSSCIQSRQATDVTQLNQSLPFNKYAWLTTHNSFATTATPALSGVPRLTFENQEDNVTTQLNNGVRGLMLDMYDFENDIWLCHSFGGKCYNYTAFGPAVNTLKEIEAFLAKNTNAIITIFIEDYVKTNKGLTNVFTTAGLMKYWFPLSKMPKNGQDWPSVSEMLANNQRLIVFTSVKSKEASEAIAYEWNYVVENQYGSSGLQTGKCTKRDESAALDSRSQSLFLENFFPTDPNIDEACTDNGTPLSNMLSVCYAAAGKRWANFLAVDYYKRGKVGSAFGSVDKLNGNLLCGCANIYQCEKNLAAGVCNTAAAAPPDVTAQAPSSSQSTSPPPPAPSNTGYLTHITPLLMSMSLFLSLFTV